ncbi:esterase FrsA [Proteus cibi]|uniref:esterase FrsA n=1 Tax=Proteus cibi TaxID=2050966 RepID=UPI0035A60F27
MSNNTNLSETLFKPRAKHAETSTLIQYTHPKSNINTYSVLNGASQQNWYRTIQRLLWIWRGISPIEIEEVLSRIAVQDAPRSDDKFIDTVVGYRKGGWSFEWSHQAMIWQQKALREESGDAAADCWLQAAHLYSIAAYPFINGDFLADQAVILSMKAFENATKFSSFEVKKLTFKLEGKGTTTGFLHLPKDCRGPYPTVLFCGGLDGLQSDYVSFFRHYLSPKGIAMLTLDMPAIGYSVKQKLTEDTCQLQGEVLKQLSEVPWIDHTRVGVMGFRFGGNIAVRLAYIYPKLIKGVVALGPLIHAFFTQAELQKKIPVMYLDVLASRLGLWNIDENNLRLSLSSYSLKNQGLIGRRMPVPMMGVYWKGDEMSPKEDSQLIARSSMDGDILAINDKPLYEGLELALQKSADWIYDKLI